MSPRCLTLFPLLLCFAFATAAMAQDEPGSPAVRGVFPQGFDQAVYKGLVGHVLDAVPMDPAGRLDLQRTSTVVSNTWFGRSLAVLAGLSNPVLMLGGFVWGMWAASNIKLAEVGVKLTAGPAQSDGGEGALERIVALPDRSSAVDDAPANTVPEPILVSSLSAEDSDELVLSPPRVIKVWLPQRSPALSR